jgi:hypothetical protein
MTLRRDCFVQFDLTKIIRRHECGHLILIKAGTARMLNLASMNWLNIEAAPFDRDLEVAVINSEGTHAVVFPCRRILGGWVNAATRAPVKIHPTHWRDWDTISLAR